MQKSKMKNLVAISLAIFLAVSILASVNVAKADTTASITLDPAAVNITTNPSLAIGSEFTVTAKVAGVTDLWGYSVTLSYNPAIVQIKYEEVEGESLPVITAGTFFPATGVQWIATADNVAGQAIANDLFTTAGGNRDGAGDLAIFTFVVVGYGSTDIAISASSMVQPTPSGQTEHPVIEHTTTGATFNLPPPPPSGPQAKFTPNDGTWYLQNDNVVLDASSSVPGYDTLGAAEIAPITLYQWTIVGPSGALPSLTGATAFFTPTVAGQYTITLTVTATDPTPPTHPDFVPTSTVTKIINVRAPPQGADIDVYTSRGGNGPAAASDAFGPQELVIAYALVTYNNVPVVNQDVSFEIQNNNSQTIDYRSARTNSAGIATIEYRLPWPDTAAPEEIFGANWTIVASTSVAQTVKTDKVAFEFNYIIKIDSVTTLPSLTRGTSVKVNVTLSNIRSVDVDTVVTIVIYDENQVPVAVTTVDQTVNAESYARFAGTLYIPTYAFVGQAVVYVNSLTNLPSLGGVPFCPEKTAEFQIGI